MTEKKSVHNILEEKLDFLGAQLIWITLPPESKRMIQKGEFGVYETSFKSFLEYFLGKEKTGKFLESKRQKQG